MPLALGVLLDEHERIVLANTMFAEKVGRTPEALLGVTISELPWSSASKERFKPEMPWRQVRKSAVAQVAVPLKLTVRIMSPPPW